MSVNHSLLDFNKHFRGSARPAKFSLLQTVGDMGNNSTKLFDELMIKGSELVKTSHIMDDLRLGPFLNGSDLLGIRKNSISRDYKSEKLNLRREKGALLRIDVQRFSSQFRTNLTQMV